MEPKTVTCTVRLPIRTQIEIDRQRGKTPRSEYLETMIEATTWLIAPTYKTRRLTTTTAAEVAERKKLRVVPEEES